MNTQYAKALEDAMTLMQMEAELEPTSALKQAASDCGIAYGDDMARFVDWALAQREFAPPKMSQIVAQYPNMYIHRTGGNCTALRHDLDDGSYLLLTSADDGVAPDDDDRMICCGFFAADDCEGVCEELPVDRVKAWIDGKLGFK